MINHFRRLVYTLSSMKTRPLVLCGPSGAGKSTLQKRLVEEFGSKFGFSVSHTTRKPRAGEENGVHYHFVEKQDMEKAIQNGEFIESAVFAGNTYGTSKKAVGDVLEKGQICILDIDAQGVKQIKLTDLNPLCVFIKPPSVDELEKRLKARGTETEDSLGRRLSVARMEIEYGEGPGNFDKIIINDDVDRAYSDLRTFLVSALEDLQSAES